jgi:hypothetical protein
VPVIPTVTKMPAATIARRVPPGACQDCENETFAATLTGLVISQLSANPATTYEQSGVASTDIVALSNQICDFCEKSWLNTTYSDSNSLSDSYNQLRLGNL